MKNITKIFVTVMVMTALFIPAITVDARGATLRDARINLGGSYFGATSGLSNPAPAPTVAQADTGVSLSDVPATGIEVNVYTVSFALLMLIVSVMIARQAYTLQLEAEKNREMRNALA